MTYPWYHEANKLPAAPFPIPNPNKLIGTLWKAYRKEMVSVPIGVLPLYTIRYLIVVGEKRTNGNALQINKKTWNPRSFHYVIVEFEAQQLTDSGNTVPTDPDDKFDYSKKFWYSEGNFPYFMETIKLGIDWKQSYAHQGTRYPIANAEHDRRSFVRAINPWDKGLAFAELTRIKMMGIKYPDCGNMNERIERTNLSEMFSLALNETIINDEMG